MQTENHTVLALKNVSIFICDSNAFLKNPNYSHLLVIHKLMISKLEKYI